MFEWIRDLDKQRTYTYELELVTKPLPPRIPRYVGMEWVRDIDQQLTYFDPSGGTSLTIDRFSKVNVWSEPYITIEAYVDASNIKELSYRVKLGDEDLIINETIQSTPFELSLKIPTAKFVVGDNSIDIVFVEDGEEFIFPYTIVKEDRDTFEFVRNFDFKEDYIVDPKINVAFGEGLSLKEVGSGEVVVSIPTEGKGAIKEVTVGGGENDVRFLISKDKVNYQGYRGGEWVVTDELNLLSEGMTKTELEGIEQSVWADWFENEAHKHDFEILIGIYSENPNTPIIRSITVDYVENEAPILLDVEITPDSVHNEYAILNANVKDYEGDKISFKVLIKKEGTDEFVQVSPEEGWYNKISSDTEIVQAFNYPYFNLGHNQIKLVVKDERGAESEWVGNVTYLNTDPTILITYDDTQMTAVIGDEDGDDIAYRLFINDEMIFDYTTMINTPIEFTQLFDSSILKFGENNEVRLEVRDSHGGEVSETINVLGTYRGLMFKNDAGFYFVNDRGEFLRDLVFGGVLVAGQTSPTRKVTLENRNGFAIKSTKINALEKDFVTGARVEISKTEMPFNPIEILKIPEVMANLDTKDFYVRVVSNRTAHKGAYFYIDAKAEPAK